MVDALERIYAALDEGGVVVDTQPVSPRPPVVGSNGPLGTLDMRDWAETIASVDARIVETVERGLFSVALDELVVVTDVYDDLAELVEEANEYAGTRVPRELTESADTASGAVEVHQDVRVRVLARQ